MPFLINNYFPIWIRHDGHFSFEGEALASISPPSWSRMRSLTVRSSLDSMTFTTVEVKYVNSFHPHLLISMVLLESDLLLTNLQKTGLGLGGSGSPLLKCLTITYKTEKAISSLRTYILIHISLRNKNGHFLRNRKIFNITIWTVRDMFNFCF